VAFLETLAIVAFTLGSIAGLVLVALPLLLLQALTSIERKLALERMKESQKEGARNATFLAKVRAYFVTTPREYLEDQRSTLRSSLRNGMISASAFFVLGTFCLMLLLQSYLVVQGVPYVLMSTAGDWALAILFSVGMFFLIVLAVSFYGAARATIGLTNGNEK